MMIQDDPVPGVVVSPQSNAAHPPTSPIGDEMENSIVGGRGPFLLQSTTSMDDDEELMEQTKHTFPGILMSLALDPQNHDTIAFLPDGKYFCMRMKRFALELLSFHFGTGGDGVNSMEEFLDVARDWGFRQVLHDPVEPEVVNGHSNNSNNGSSSRGGSRTSSTSISSDSDIQVFRHPLFIKGDWRRCAAIQKFGEEGFGGSVARHRRRHSSASLQMPLHDSTTLVEDTIATQSPATLAESKLPKRQQPNVPPSPKHRKRLSLSIEEEESLFFQDLPATTPAGHQTSRDSLEEEVREEMVFQRLQQEQSRRDSVRSVAMSLTSEQLDRLDKPPQKNAIHNENGGGESSFVGPPSTNSLPPATCGPPLVDQAVKSATHTIVTDAIETLLHDEMHTIVTYVKHEKELSRSSLPGVVPMSKQLFEPSLHQQQQHQESPPPQHHDPQHTASVVDSIFSSDRLRSEGHVQEEEEDQDDDDHNDHH